MTVSIVTGAGSGIGAETARLLADRGDQVVCADVRLDAARATAESLRDALAVGVDVRDRESNESMVKATVDKFGPPDVLATCAGVEISGLGHEFGEDDFDRVIGINVKGSWLSARAVARAMIAAGRAGSIVMIGSINSVRGNRGASAYCASKGAVLMLGRTLALDWAPYGIRVNIVGPGPTDTPMSAGSLSDPVKRQKMMEKIPLDRPAQPADIAAVIAFLSSAGSSFMTGAYVPVDGGALALW